MEFSSAPKWNCGAVAKIGRKALPLLAFISCSSGPTEEFRFIAAGTHPDHDTLASFRRRFLDELSGLFVQVLEKAQDMQPLKLGTILLDGTKIKAHASRHSALSHGHIEPLEIQLKAEVEALLAQAEQADQSAVPDDMDLPAEIARRQARLDAMAAAKAKTPYASKPSNRSLASSSPSWAFASSPCAA